LLLAAPELRRLGGGKILTISVLLLLLVLNDLRPQ
jgi:hypothetical protein